MPHLVGFFLILHPFGPGLTNPLLPTVISISTPIRLPPLSLLQVHPDGEQRGVCDLSPLSHLPQRWEELWVLVSNGRCPGYKRSGTELWVEH